MRLGKLLVYFETSPALRLLRSPNLPFVIDFLDRQFKQPGRIAIPHSELLAALHSYQEDLEGLIRTCRKYKSQGFDISTAVRVAHDQNRASSVV